MVDGDALEEGDVELLRDVGEARDLVRAGPARGELPGARPEGFLDGEEALALHERAFDLPVVDGRVDGAADVHLDVGAEDGVVSGQQVQLDLADGYALLGVRIRYTARRGARNTWVK